MRRILLPLLFIFLFVAEGVIALLMPNEVFGSERILVPRFLFTTILFLTIYGTKKLGLIYGFIFGLLFDVVYTEIIGIYLMLFPLLSYFISRLARALQTHIIVACLIVMFGVAILEFSVYGMNLLIGHTNMVILTFITTRFVPTIILNLIFVIVTSYPLKRHFEKLVESMKD